MMVLKRGEVKQPAAGQQQASLPLSCDAVHSRAGQPAVAPAAQVVGQPAPEVLVPSGQGQSTPASDSAS